MLLLHRLTVAVLIWPFLSDKISVDGSRANVTLCCEFGKVQIDGGCEESNEIPGTLPGIRRSNDTDEEEEIVHRKNVDFIIDEPCNYDWMASWTPENYQILENGSIYAEELGGKALSEPHNYCLFREPNSANYSAIVCRSWVGHIYWNSFCLIVAILVLFVIFIGYSIVPELKNLHGLMLRSYLASYICTYTCALIVVHTAKTRSQHIFTFSLFGMEYWGVSCVFWLNVISFDIWRTVRCFRSFDSHGQVRKKKKYIRYAIYAWTVPFILISCYVAVMCYTPSLKNIMSRQVVRRYCRMGAKSSIFLCNTFFYISTALAIKRHKKDTVDLSNGINKHHEVERQWINLHVKLYLIMGGHMIPWISWDYCPTPVTTSILVTLEMLQSIVLFFVFLWKDNIKQNLRRRFGKNRYPHHYTVSTISCRMGP